MRARVLFGCDTKRVKNWMVPGGERPKGAATLHPMDINLFKFEIASLNARSILEFGPGDSTEFFASLGLQVTTVEHMEKWYLVAKERFKDYPNVRVLKGEDEMPFTVEGLGSFEKFDLAFVDAPQGYYPLRKIHAGYEDCSRFNTALFALQHAPVVLLHDATRPCERATLNRLHLMGYKIEIINVPYGAARISWLQKPTSSIEPSETLEPSPKAKRQTRTRRKRSVTSSTECSPNSKPEMSSISLTSTSTELKTSTSSPSDTSLPGEPLLSSEPPQTKP
jgi:hypothetical protein